MRTFRVCIYGGTDLQGTPTEFVSELAYAILDLIPSAVIVTGGFRHSNKKPSAISTDAAALVGARRFARDRRVDLTQCFEAWIPEPQLDGRPDVKGVVRMTAEDGITVRVMRGRTALGRRLAMVSGVSVVVTISGKRHTEVVIEHGLELGLPILPIPNAGGDSRALLKKYHDRIAAAFAPGELKRCLERVTETIRTAPKLAAGAVVQLINTAKVGKCLVLLPYDPEHDQLYRSDIEPSVFRYMIPVRLDQIPRSDAIYANFVDAIQSTSAVIADITQLNENVMYEIGFAHGRGLTPLIFTRDATRREQLPVYFKALNVRLVTPETPLDSLIRDYLQSFRLRGMFGPESPERATGVAQ